MKEFFFLILVGLVASIIAYCLMAFETYGAILLPFSEGTSSHGAYDDVHPETDVVPEKDGAAHTDGDTCPGAGPPEGYEPIVVDPSGFRRPRF